MRLERFVIPLLAVLMIILAHGCGDDCPDLALLAFSLDLQGIEESELKVSASTEDGTILTSAEISELYSLGAGSYDLVFTHEGTEVGTLVDVCTVGALTGCDAENSPATDTPEILIASGTTSTGVSLVHNGKCP